MKIRIYGASDDLVEVEWWTDDNMKHHEDEVGAYDRPVDIGIGGDDGIVVTMQHDGKLGWISSVRLGPRFEDNSKMAWPIRVELSETGYSLAVVVECPDGTTLDFDTGPVEG